MFLSDTTATGLIVVCFLTSDEDILTGLASYTFSMVAALEKVAPQDIVVVTTWNKLVFLEKSRLTRAKVITVPQSRVPIFAPIVRAIRARSAINTLAPRAMGIISMLPYGCWPCGPRQVLTVHDLYITVPGLYKVWQRAFFSMFFPWLAKRSHKVVCVSDSTARDLHQWMPKLENKVAVVKEAAKYPVLKERIYQPSSPYCLFVANIEKNKNVECLLDALKQDRGILVKWVGRDRSGAIGRWMAINGPLENFVPVGVVDDDVLRGLYANARCLIVTSSREGFCLPVLEAHSFGVPVIASDIPVLKEVGGDGAVYFLSGSSNELLRAIKSLDDPSRALVISTRAQINAARYSWEKSARQVVELFGLNRKRA